MTNKELAAQCLIEAAELLNESAGRNGAGRRYYEEKIKKEKEKLRPLERKAKQYEHAGYEDKGPSKEASEIKDEIELLKHGKNYYDTRKYASKHAGLTFTHDNAKASRNGQYKSGCVDDVASLYVRDYNDTKNRKIKGFAETLKHKKLHDRINKRGERAKNESIDVASLLREAADLLDE